MHAQRYRTHPDTNPGPKYVPEDAEPHPEGEARESQGFPLIVIVQTSLNLEPLQFH